MKILIPKPCHENWLEMTAAEKGRFCSNCQKTVIDFTKSSDREIITAYNENKTLCGRFNNFQINRNLIIPKEKNSIWMIAATAILAFLGLGSAAAKAQESVKTEQTDNKQINDSKIIESKEESFYSGVVFDENKLPIPGANVIIKGTKIKTHTDFNGNFSIKAKKNEVLVFSYIGYKNVKFKLKDNSQIVITMEPNSTALMGEVIIRSDKD